MTAEMENLSQFVSHIKKPIWFQGKEDFIAKCLIREFLQKCSSDKIVEMLKSILSVEERMGLVKTEMESFFQNQTKSFENHMMVKNELISTDDQVQKRIKTEPKDLDYIEKPKELKITFYKCILCSNTKYENSKDIESHLTNIHSISIHCQNRFIEKEINAKLIDQAKPTETFEPEESIDESFFMNAASLLESTNEQSNEQSNERNESSVEPAQNNHEDIQNSDCTDSNSQSDKELVIPVSTDSMAEIRDLNKNHHTEGVQSNENIVKDIAEDSKATVKGQLILKCPFGVYKSPKKTTNFCKNFCPSL